MDQSQIWKLYCGWDSKEIAQIVFFSWESSATIIKVTFGLFPIFILKFGPRSSDDTKVLFEIKFSFKDRKNKGGISIITLQN